MIIDCAHDHVAGSSGRRLATRHANDVQMLRLLNSEVVEVDDLLTWTINPFQKLRTVEVEKCTVPMSMMTETVSDIKIWAVILRQALPVSIMYRIARSVAATFPQVKATIACSVSSTDVELVSPLNSPNVCDVNTDINQDCDMEITAQNRKRIRRVRRHLPGTIVNDGKLKLTLVRPSNYEWRPAPKPENDT